MSEERKPEESLISDENLLVKYVVAARLANPMMTNSTIFGQAEDMIEEHRKLFPKKVKFPDYKSLLSELMKIVEDKELHPDEELSAINNLVKDWEKSQE